MRVFADGQLKRASLGREREMMWMIASLPFWVSGACLAVGGVLAPFNRHPGETDVDLAQQFFAGTIVGGILLVIAAKIAS
jgi:ABC-type Fe3+ transport system permease subunit